MDQDNPIDEISRIEAQLVAFGSLLVGTVLPFRCRRINATGTTAQLTASYD